MEKAPLNFMFVVGDKFVIFLDYIR